jgi:hypothetical protein
MEGVFTKEVLFDQDLCGAGFVCLGISRALALHYGVAGA